MSVRQYLILTIGLLFLCLTQPALEALPIISFSTLPANGQVSGAPGSTVGWGYSITNNGTDWLVITSLNADPFTSATPNLLFDFPIIDPGATVTEPYNPSIGTGLFELLWDTSAALGFSNSGTFVLSGEWWTDNPLDGGVFIEDAPDVNASYTASVNTVPEPATFWILFTGLSLIGLVRLISQRPWKSQRFG